MIGGRDVPEEDEDDDRDDDDLLDELLLHRPDGVLDELRPVVGRHHLDALRERGLQLLELRLDALDHVQGVLARAHHDDAADHVSLAVEVRHAPPQLGTERDRRHVLHEHRGPALRAEHEGLEVLDALHVAAAADHVLAPAELDEPAADVVVALADRGDHRVERDLERGEGVRVHRDLVLPDLAADGGDLRDPRDALDRVAQVPVLEGAQLVGRVLAAPIHERVLVDPPDARGVGAELHLHVRRELLGDLGQVLEDARPRPVRVRPVLEDHVDVAEPEVREAADRLHLRRAEEGGGDGIGDLVLDDVGAPVPARVDDDLRVGEVRQRVERDVPHRPRRPDERDDRRGEDEVPVLGGEADDSLDHGASVRARRGGPRRPARPSRRPAVRRVQGARPSRRPPAPQAA